MIESRKQKGPGDLRQELISTLLRKSISIPYAATYFPAISQRELYRFLRNQVGAVNSGSVLAIKQGLKNLRKLPDNPGGRRFQIAELRPGR